jgi:hypothetical protein
LWSKVESFYVALSRNAHSVTMLLDEPMSDLDAKLKEQLRVEIQRLHRNLDATMVYVTHDQNEAMTMSDRIALMEEGAVVQYDDPETLFDRPDSEYVATFVGTPTTNVISFEIESGEAVHPRGAARLDVPPALADRRRLSVGVRPRSLGVGGGTLELDAIIEAWTSERSRAEALGVMRDHDAIVGPLYDVGDAFEDEHYRARDDLVSVADDEFGTVRTQAPVPKFSRTPGSVDRLDGDHGEHTEEVYRERLGLSDEDLRHLREEGII